MRMRLRLSNIELRPMQVQTVPQGADRHWRERSARAANLLVPC